MLIFAILGFAISVLLQNPVLTYLTILLAGAMAGRIFFTKRFNEPILPFVLIIAGFLLGYLVGSFWVARLMAFIVFVVGFSASYYLHLKNFFVIFKSKNFLK